MKQYLDLLNHVRKNGIIRDDRTGTGTQSSFGYQMRFDLSSGFPLLTTKKLHMKSIIHELLWFLSGSTNIAPLKKAGVSIWDEWANQHGELGPVYGFQWRSWPTDDGNNFDQIASVISEIKENPNSRRLIVSAWNVSSISDMALPPCHILCQFCVTEGNKLSCSLYQRSGDVGLGVPFNIASYSILTHLIAKHCGLEAKEFVYFLGNAHIYDDHLETLKEQVLRKPYPFPKLLISDVKLNIDDYVVEDFKLIDYKYHEKLTMKMRK